MTWLFVRITGNIRAGREAEGYLAPIAIAVLNLIVLISGRETLFGGVI